MMPTDHRGASSRKPSSTGAYVGSRGHYHKSGDSGVGSLSDYDNLAANPDRDFAAPPDYGQSSSSVSSRRLDQALLHIERLKAVNSQLEADKQSIHVQNQELKASLRELQERTKKYKEDNTILSDQARDLEELCTRLRTDNDGLQEDLRRLRSSPPRDTATSSSSSSGLRRRDSKRESPGHREEKERDQRLRDRLDGKSDKGPSSSTSGQSGHSGHSGHSGRSRRDSFVAPSGRPAVVVSVPVPPNSSRSQTVYVPSSSRTSPAMSPAPHAAATIPRTPANAAFPSYADPSYFDPLEQGGGDYVHEPLPRERQSKR